MISEYLNALKEAKGLTLQQVSEKSKVSLSTIERIFAGKAKNTSFEVLRSITFVLEGNMDDLARAAESTNGAHPETWGRGPDVPTVPDKARDLATAEDLNRLVSIFTDALHERDEIYREHTESRTAAYDRALSILRDTQADELKALDEKQEQAIEVLKAEFANERESYERALIRRETFCYICLGILVMFLVVLLIAIIGK